MKRGAVFLDRDGTLMRDVGYCRDPAQVDLLPGVRGSLQRLKAAGFALVIVTNQSGIGRGLLTEQEFWAVQRALDHQLGDSLFDAVYFAPDTPAAATARRKPGPGMLTEAAIDLGVDLEHSFMVGDKASDIEAGQQAGVKATILLGDPQPDIRPTYVAADFPAVADFILAGRF
jgi:D-glycero-D-manno-heptose 1,7-bisphosphate phosphatase